jgi:transposase-like protein/IS1 family transposase
MTCIRCKHQTCTKFGHFGKRRIQRWRCNSCKTTFCEPHERLTRDTMLSRPEATEQAIKCLLEGCSVRSTERLTGLDRNTIMRLLVVAGERCEKLLEQTLGGLRVRDVQCDEMWGYVGMKEKMKGRERQHIDTLGDAYTYVAIERNTKLILAWHLAKRNRPETLAFMLNLRRATDGKFQLTTDGWPAYPDAVERVIRY